MSQPKNLITYGTLFATTQMPSPWSLKVISATMKPPMPLMDGVRRTLDLLVWCWGNQILRGRSTMPVE